MSNFFIKAVILFVLLAVLPCAAQEDNKAKPCASESSQPQSPLNLRLGMSPEQAQAVLGKSVKIKIKKSGQRTFFQNFIKKRPPSSLTGVRALYLRFLDRRLYQIEIFYEERSGVKTLADFIASLSASWNFPVSAWQIETGEAKIECAEFFVVADKILNPRIEITDKAALAKVEETREKEG